MDDRFTDCTKWRLIHNTIQLLGLDYFLVVRRLSKKISISVNERLSGWKQLIPCQRSGAWQCCVCAWWMDASNGTGRFSETHRLHENPWPIEVIFCTIDCVRKTSRYDKIHGDRPQRFRLPKKVKLHLLCKLFKITFELIKTAFKMKIHFCAKNIQVVNLSLMHEIKRPHRRWRYYGGSLIFADHRYQGGSLIFADHGSRCLC